MTNPTDNHVLKTVAKREENFVFQVKTDKEIDDPKYITANINNNLLTKPPTKLDKTTEEGKNIWRFTSTNALLKGSNTLLVEVTDKAGNPSSAQGQFMVLDELPAPTIDMTHNTNAAGKDSPPYMLNQANMADSDKRKLNIKLNDNRLFPYVEMTAKLISESPSSSSVLSIKKNNPDNNWTVEISEKQADGKYTLKVIATDVLKMTKETRVDFVVDTTPPETPTIKLRDSVTKHAESKATQETTQEKPNFVIGSIPNDIYKIKIKITGDDYDYEVDNPNNVENKLKEWSGIQNALKDNQTYSITVTFTDKAGNTSSNKDDPFKIKKIVPYTFTDPTLILAPETDSGTQGDFKTNHNQPVLLFKNMSDAEVTKVNLKLENKTDKKTYTYSLKDFELIDVKNSKEYKIQLIKESSLTKEAPFPEGEYKVTVELTYASNEQYTKATTFEKPLTINRDKPDAVHEVKYTFDETADGAKTIRIEGKKPKNTDIFIQFDGQTEINIKKQNGDSLFSDDTFSTTQNWGQQKNFTLFVKDDIGNQSENNEIEIPQPPTITRYRALHEDKLDVFVNKEGLKKDDKIVLKNQSDETYEHTVTEDNLKTDSFQFTTSNAFTGKFTAYVSRAGHESQQIQRTIPKTPTKVDYTFVGKGNYFVVKGGVQKGETLNLKIGSSTQKSQKADENNKVLRTKALEHNSAETEFELFSSNEEGGESQVFKDTIKPIVLYWDSTTGHYRARFSNYNPDNDIGNVNPDFFLYPYQLKLGSFSLIKYKLLEFKESQNYRVIEFDDSVLYELCRYLDYPVFKQIQKGNPWDHIWKFHNYDAGVIITENENERKLKFVSLEDVLKFMENDQTLDPEINIDKKNHLMKTIAYQFDIRPYEVQIEKNSDGKYLITGKMRKLANGSSSPTGEFFLLNGVSNPLEIETKKYTKSTGEFEIETGGEGTNQFFLYFKTTETDISITSLWVRVQPVFLKKDNPDYYHENSSLDAKFTELYKLAKKILEKNNSAAPAPPSEKNSEQNIDASQEENARSTEDQSSDVSSSETTNQSAQSTETPPQESTTEEPSERSKRSTSLTEQEENPADTEEQQLNPTQPQKEDTPRELLEKPKTSALQNPIELNNPITSEENTTADLTPSFTLNAPKEAPDAVKAVVTLDNRPEYALELIDNQGVFTVEMPLAEGPHELKVKFIDPDGDWISLDKTFTIDASSERILSSMETPDRYQSDLSTGSKTIPSKENADMLMMTPVLHLPEHEEESTYYS